MSRQQCWYELHISQTQPRCLYSEAVLQCDLPHQRLHCSGVPHWRIIIRGGARRWCCWRKTGDGCRVFESIHRWFFSPMHNYKHGKCEERCPRITSQNMSRSGWATALTLGSSYVPPPPPPCFYLIFFYFLPVNASGWNAFCDDLTIKSLSLSEHLPLLHCFLSSNLWPPNSLLYKWKKKNLIFMTCKSVWYASDVMITSVRGCSSWLTLSFYLQNQQRLAAVRV